MVCTVVTVSSPVTVMTQSFTNTCEAYFSRSGEEEPHAPAGSTWLLVILMSRPLVVVIWMNAAVTLLGLWGTKTTSEKDVLPAASADSTLSPAMIWEICRSSPDSSLTVSDPAKQSAIEVLFGDDDTLGSGVPEISWTFIPLAKQTFKLKTKDTPVPVQPGWEKVVAVPEESIKTDDHRWL